MISYRIHLSNIFITNEFYFVTLLSNIIEIECGGISMDVIKRIDILMKERNWSDYKLSAESGLSSSTIANIHRRNTVPSISTLESICSAFGITLAQFFTEDSFTVQLNYEQRELFNHWISLTDNQKELIYKLIKEMK